jgi:hypothetical protein
MQASIIYGIIGLVVLVVTLVIFVPMTSEKLSNEVLVEAPKVETVILESPTVATSVAKLNRITFTNYKNQKMVKIIVQASLFDIQDEKYKVVFFNKDDTNALSNDRSFDMVQEADKFQLLFEEPLEKSDLLSFSDVKIMFRKSTLMYGNF